MYEFHYRFTSFSHLGPALRKGTAQVVGGRRRLCCRCSIQLNCGCCDRALADSAVAAVGDLAILCPVEGRLGLRRLI
jgi:hypothetical protein